MTEFDQIALLPRCNTCGVEYAAPLTGAVGRLVAAGPFYDDGVCAVCGSWDLDPHAPDCAYVVLGGKP
jgi:hypothetical protein